MISLNKKVFFGVILLAWVIFVLTACGSDPQASARKQLEKQNISVSPQNLFKAIEMGDVQHTFLLLEAGIDINIRVGDMTPLIAAIEWDKQKLVDHLLTQWVPDVRMRQDNGQTALMAAVKKSNEKLVVRLLSLGADVDAALNDGTTPLMSAIVKGNHELVDTLLKSRADPNLKNNNNETAFSMAESKGKEKILRLLKKDQG